MICRADETMLPSLRRVWSVCFDESEAGTGFVFDSLLHPGQMLVKAIDGKNPVAMINWKLLRFTTPSGPVSGAYVFGVATLPEYRGKGISKALMNELHTVLANEGAALSCLIPAGKSLFDFYAGQGFETSFYYKLVRARGKDLSAAENDGELDGIGLDSLETLRNSVFGGRRLFGAWDADYLRYADSECRHYGGEVLRFSRSGRTGYAVCFPREDGVLLVKEAVVDREDTDSLLGALHRRFKAESYHLRLPADFDSAQGEIVPFAMTRWYGKQNQEQGGEPWFAFGLD